VLTSADGEKEIVVGISEGLVVALSGQCKKVWSTRLPSPPAFLRCVDPVAGTRRVPSTTPGPTLPWVIVGCDDGTVAALDEKGALVRLGQVTGRPLHMMALETPAGPLAVLATDQGEVKGFKAGE